MLKVYWDQIKEKSWRSKGFRFTIHRNGLTRYFKLKDLKQGKKYNLRKLDEAMALADKILNDEVKEGFGVSVRKAKKRSKR